MMVVGGGERGVGFNKRLMSSCHRNKVKRKRPKKKKGKKRKKIRDFCRSGISLRTSSDNSN